MMKNIERPLISPTTSAVRNPPELFRHILKRTGRRVRDLAVDLMAESVVLRGTTATYYVKQLAQQGVRDLMPRVQLQNSIIVENSNT